jgi:hypothetical protein
LSVLTYTYLYSITSYLSISIPNPSQDLIHSLNILGLLLHALISLQAHSLQLRLHFFLLFVLAIFNNSRSLHFSSYGTLSDVSLFCLYFKSSSFRF